MVEKLDLRLTAFEKRIGLIPFALLIGLLSIGLAMLYVMPRFQPVAHGVQFSSLSSDPFDFRPLSCVSRASPRIVVRYCMFLLIALIPLFLYRTWVSQHVDVAYDVEFYFSESCGIEKLTSNRKDSARVNRRVGQYSLNF